MPGSDFTEPIPAAGELATEGGACGLFGGARQGLPGMGRTLLHPQAPLACHLSLCLPQAPRLTPATSPLWLDFPFIPLFGYEKLPEWASMALPGAWWSLSCPHFCQPGMPSQPPWTQQGDSRPGIKSQPSAWHRMDTRSLCGIHEYGQQEHLPGREDRLL